MPRRRRPWPNDPEHSGFPFRVSRIEARARAFDHAGAGQPAQPAGAENSLVVQDVHVGPPGASLLVVQSVAFQMGHGLIPRLKLRRPAELVIVRSNLGSAVASR